MRGKALEGFDGLISTFSDAELYLATFPEDKGIKAASMELIVKTLEAIERAIGFFLSKEGKVIVLLCPHAAPHAAIGRSMKLRDTTTSFERYEGFCHG